MFSRTRLLVFVALFVPYSYFNHSDGWNQGVRFAELHAIVLKGTLRIDDYLSYTGDRALIDGHYYSEKAPAVALAALPSFAITVGIQKLLGIDPDADAARRWSDWISTALSVGLIAAVGGVAFFELIDARLGRLTAVTTTFAVFLGSITFPYATALFAHAGTIGLIAFALFGVLSPASPRRDAIAGLAAGFAVASEYPAVLTVAVIGFYLASLDVKRAIRFTVGTLPALALIMANNYAIAGSPFRLSYGSNPLFPELTATSSYGFNAPDLTAMRQVLIGEYRGLWFWSPVLLMAIPGIAMLLRADRRTAIMTIGGIVLVLLQVAAFYTWFGGNAVGPRYLAPVIPLFGLAAAYAIHRLPEIGIVLTMVSIGLMGMVTAIAIDPPGDVLMPLQSFYLVRIDQERWAMNLGTLIGLPRPFSLIVPSVFPMFATWQLMRRQHVTV